MSLAENLLNSLDETTYENMRIAGSGEEEHIIVGQDRSITVPNALKTIAVKGDKDVETATIDCVRYWDGHDLSTFAIYLNYILPNGDEGTYIPKSITKSVDFFTFDWKIGSEITYAKGNLTFWIVAKLTDSDGNLIKQWSSFQNYDCTIARGGDKIYVPEKQTDQDVISQAISVSRASAEIAEQKAKSAKESADLAVLYNGKSAYAYAKEGGYEGTEKEFATDINPYNINAKAETFIVTELAKRGQLKPEFANDVSECTDTTKLYVLPDGYIYAYMTFTTNGATYTNWLPISTDTDGSIYNDVGYADGYRINSSGNPSSNSGTCCTGFIPCKRGDVIRLKNIPITNNQYYNGIVSYNSNKSFLYNCNGKSLNSIADTDNKIVTIDTSNISSGYLPSDTAYVRIYFQHTSSEYTVPDWDYTQGVITVNEEIKTATTTTTDWTNTGHAFVPADYEDRILAVEKKTTENSAGINSLNNRVSELKKAQEELENSQSETVVDYVKTEAERVAKLANTYQNGSTLTFAAVSDSHYNYGGISSGIEHLGQALDIIRKHTPLDFFAHFGDWLVGSRSSTIEDSIEEFEEQNAKFAIGVRDVLNIRMNGNHDALPYNKDGVFTAAQLFSYIGKWNGKEIVTEYGNMERNYGYVDFAKQKIRVIFLNTSDLKGDAIPDVGTAITNDHRISGVQLNWFANTALKMTDKSDATDWGIVLCSHAPITWNDNLWKVFTILQKHENGASGTITSEDGVGVGYDFTSLKKASLIAYFHGHVHCFKVADYVIGATTIPRIAIPNACNGRENEYPADTWGEDTTYPKTADTAKDTAFNIVTIDRENRKIYCTNYGAGYDREISY